jgi:hypothetical protein
MQDVANLVISEGSPMQDVANHVISEGSPMQYVANPVILLFYCMYNVPLLLAVCNTSSFLTQSVQLIFSVLLQHHISELSAVSSSSTTQSYAPNVALYWFLP